MGCSRLTLVDLSQAQRLWLQVICVSRTSKQNTVLRARIPPKRVFVIPNGQSVGWQGCAPGGVRAESQQHCIICASQIRKCQPAKQSAVLPACVLKSTWFRQELHARPAAVDAARFRPDPSQAPGHRIQIVALSRLVHRKGIDLLAVTIPEFCARHAHVDFLIGEMVTFFLAVTIMPACSTVEALTLWIAGPPSQITQHTAYT